jgi:hypothetical protein
MAAAGTAAGVVLEACQFCVGVRRGPGGATGVLGLPDPAVPARQTGLLGGVLESAPAERDRLWPRVARLGLRRSGGDRHESKIDNQPTPDRNPYLPSAVLLPVEEAAQHRRDKQADHRQ